MNQNVWKNALSVDFISFYSGIIGEERKSGGKDNAIYFNKKTFLSFFTDYVYLREYLTTKNTANHNKNNIFGIFVSQFQYYFCILSCQF